MDDSFFEDRLFQHKEEGGEDKANAQEVFGKTQRKQDSFPLSFPKEKLDEGFEVEAGGFLFQFLFSLQTTEPC